MRSLHIPRKNQLVLVSTVILLLTGCSSAAAPNQSDTPAPTEKTEPAQPSEPNKPTETVPKPTEGKPPVTTPPKAPSEQEKPPVKTKPVEQKPSKTPTESAPMPDLEVVGEPQSMTVLVNKQRQLPDNYQPTDLVFPNVPYLLPAKSEKRQMRKEAAEALEQLFAAAKADGVSLAGVSAYRSHAYQKALFNRYVQKDGLEKARTYSAVPGTSEHETGLAIDVSGADGKCAATSCFAGTKEAVWLAQHAQEYGFIIRYPEGKDDITGYMYEPWHLRYVGNEVAQAIGEKQLTLEEYFGVAAVSSDKK
ncbi:D-alanyl-D-alanine carboxypeptidase family protein [Brevibacillus choshinensis]|uniref:M15 family metallopeptidase n=1 Tax=Brevibacillus choshinensis TaxID=54911 RepID=UPI002E228470|nr:D-alanyl-D-alanine carboxypeptidase family protein [Brevibacillus choshinensis]MED4581188.1 D-alanyl-D-alanine carboxypeptidase family protein [Brevibacillus choshinensis]